MEPLYKGQIKAVRIVMLLAPGGVLWNQAMVLVLGGGGGVGLTLLVPRPCQA